MNRHRNKISLLWRNLLVVAVFALTILPLDAQKFVFFENPITFNGTTIPNYTSILNISSKDAGDSAVYGSEIVTDSSYTTVLLSGNNAYDMRNDYENLIFELSFELTDTCWTFLVDLMVNDSLSSFDTLIVALCNFGSHNFFYTDSIYCQDTPEVLPTTNIPLSYIMLESAEGISFGPEWELQPNLSTPGDYFVRIETDYCLDPGFDEIQLTILSSDQMDFTDPILVCSGSSNHEFANSGYIFYKLDEGLSGDPVTNFEETGSYIIQHTDSECSSLDTVEVVVSEPAEIELITEDLCDHISLTVESFSNQLDSILWWNNEIGANTTTNVSGNVWVKARDENNCIVSAGLDITFEPLAITSVNYSVENATCWDEGIVSDLEVSLKYDAAGATYQLVNTVSGGVVGDYYSVQEGIYKVQAFDDKGCVVESNQQITVLQDCLNEYPVFTPDSDGVEDEYFIPHEGTIKIYDRSGKLLREIATPAYWDGKDDAGNHLPMGNYVMLTESGRAVNITIVR